MLNVIQFDWPLNLWSSCQTKCFGFILPNCGMFGLLLTVNDFLWSKYVVFDISLSLSLSFHLQKKRVIRLIDHDYVFIATSNPVKNDDYSTISYGLIVWFEWDELWFSHTFLPFKKKRNKHSFGCDGWPSLTHARFTHRSKNHLNSSTLFVLNAMIELW